MENVAVPVEEVKERVDEATSFEASRYKADQQQTSQQQFKSSTASGNSKAVRVRPEREPGWGDYFRVFTYAKKWDFVLMAAAGMASIGAGVTTPLMNVVFGRLVGNFTTFGTSGSATTRSSFERQLDRQCLYIFILFLARFSLNYVSKFSFRLIGIRISAAIRLHYLSSLLAQTVHVLDSMPPGAAAGTITSTANTLQLGISEKLGTFLEYGASIVTAIIVAFVYSWRITLVTVSAVFFIAFVVTIFLPFIIKGMSQHDKAETRAGAVATETFSAIRMVYACGAQGRMSESYSRWVREAQKHATYTSPFMASNFGLIFFGLYGAFALCFWYGTKAYAEGLVGGIGTIVIVLMSVFLMAISLERMSTPLIAASKATVAAATFFAVIDAPPPERGSLRGPDVSGDGDITFEGVTFAYPGRPETKVLDNLDLTIEAGKITAIVGPSGSGKSTIVGLLERWYTLRDQVVIEAVEQSSKKKRKNLKGKDKSLDVAPEKDMTRSFWAKLNDNLKRATGKAQAEQEEDDDGPNAATPDEKEAGSPVQLSGRIMTSGHNLDEMDVKWWRSQIGLVQQEPFLFNDTIYANVMHGLIGTQWENESLEVKQGLAREACKEAFADEFIDRLPEKMDTQVGDSGLKLSGGQKQRVAIARSIVKKPKILILDEATSAIDVRSEKIIQAALDRVSKGRTTIMIAHRLSTISQADNIVVLQGGKLMEQGTHESLLGNEEGVYSGLVRAQRLAFGKEEQEEDSEGPEKEEDLEDMQAILSREKSAPAAADGGTESDLDATWKDQGLVGSFGRLLYEQKNRVPFYSVVTLAAAAVGCSAPLQAYLFAQVIGVFTLPRDGGGFLSQAAWWSLMWFVLAVCIGFAYFVMAFFAIRLQYYICAAYREQYFSAAIRQRITFFDQEENSVGALAARVQGDPKQLEELLGMNMGMVLCSVFQLIGALTIAYIYGWKLSLVATFVTVPIGLGCAYYRFKYELQFVKLSAAVFAESSKWAAEAIGAFRCVSSLTLEDVILARYEELLHEHVMSAYRKARWSTVIFALSDSLSLACQALIFWYGGHLLASGEYGVVNFFVCYMAVMVGAESAGQGFSFGPNAAQASAAANRILSLRESRGEHPQGPNQGTPSDKKRENGRIIPDTEGGVRVELKDVSFKYPTRDVSIFRHLNITVGKGQFVALVGASGAGKSSIVGLMERFYDVQHGSIECNGVDIRDVDAYEYRKLLSLVAQEPTLFQGTIKENILLGMPDSSTVTDAQLHQACRDASIHDFLVSLPQGYNTNVGSRGVALSGGQRQRIAIARAIIRDPKILLLDEATSSLDSENEKQISAALRKVAKNRTTIAVAHRLSTIQHADVIYVLGEGRVLETGNHAELLKAKGLYWQMCQSQALDR